MLTSSDHRKNTSFNIAATRTSSGGKPKSGTGAVAGKIRIPLKTGIMIVDNSKKADRYFVLFFFICTVILYGNTVLNKWAADDKFVTGPQNELVRKGFPAIPGIFSSFYVETKGNGESRITDYRPISQMTFAIEYGLWGEDNAGLSHIINLLLYFWISTLLFFILKRLLKNYNILFPFLITLVFMAHPVHTEVVDSLKNRDELLSFLCGLGGLHFFLMYNEKKKRFWFFAALVVFTIGCLCKSSILSFIALYPLVMYFFADMKPKNLFRIFFAVLFVGLMAYFLPRLFLPRGIQENSFIENPLFTDKSLWLRTGTGLMSLLFYLRILVFPHPLLYYYGYNMLPVSGWGNILVMISFLLHLGLIVYAIRKFREKHILSFAILYYFIAIAIYTNVVTPVAGIVGERFVFNASLGFVITLVYLIFRLFRTEPRSLTIEFSERAMIVSFIILLLIPYTAMTINRNREWRSPGDLYDSDIKYLDKSVRANLDFAGYMTNEVTRDPDYQQNGRVNEHLQQVILSHYRTALKMYPDDYTTLNDLAMVYINLYQRFDSGIIFLKKAISLRPELQPAWVNMAEAYRKKNELDSAITCYQKVLQINPGALTSVFKMADLYYEKGESGKAVKLNEDVMKACPDLDVPYFNIGYYFILQGDTITAIRYWEQAARRNLSYEVCTNLSRVYRARGDMEKAKYYNDFAGDAVKRRKSENIPFH